MEEGRTAVDEVLVRMMEDSLASAEDLHEGLLGGVFQRPIVDGLAGRFFIMDIPYKDASGLPALAMLRSL